MKKEKFVCLFSLVVLSAGNIAFADSVFDWSKEKGLSVTDAASWNDEGNWSSGGIPNGIGAVADLSAARTGGGGKSVERWIRIPQDGVTLGQVKFKVSNSGAPMPYFIGGKITMQSANGTAKITRTTNGGYWFVPVYAPGDLQSQDSYFCEDVKVDGTFYVTAGTPEFRFDRFAQDGTGVMINPGPTNQIDVGTGLKMFAPWGKEMTKSQGWQTQNLPAGSVYAVARGTRDALEMVPIGAELFGDPLKVYPAGTFIKHIFNSKWIEASLASTNAAEFCTFWHGEKTQVCYQDVKILRRRGADVPATLALNKKRQEDVFKVNVADFQSQYESNVFRLDADEGYFPGVLSLNKTTGYTAVLECANAHLEFAKQQDDFTGIKKLSVNDGCSLRVTVSNHVAAVFETITNMSGSVVKDGPGLLLLGAMDAPAKSMTVNEGALAFTSGAPVREIESLTLSEGTGVGAVMTSAGLGSAAVEVSGALEQGEDNVIFISGDLDRAKTGTYEMLKSSSISALDAVKWRCETSRPSERRAYALIVEDGRVLLSVTGTRGLVLLFR